MAIKVTQPEINLRETLKDLDKPSGTAGQAMLRAETPQEQFNLIGAGRRNILINGDFQVSQRGDFTTASSASNGAFFVDRWYVDVGTVAFNKEQTTGIDIYGTPAISKGVKLTATASGTSYMGIRQKIENPTQYVGRTITYSGYVKSNSSNARLVTFTQGTTQVETTNTHSGSGNWEKLSVTFTMTGNPSTNWYVDAFIASSGVGNVDISSGDYIEVTNLQLEIGKVATPFEHRSYGEELALCQRYYYQLGGIGGVAAATSLSSGSMYTATAVNLYVPFPVPMRSTPGISKTVNGTGNWLNLYIGSTGTTGNPTPQVGDNGTDSARVYIPSAHSGNSPSAAGAGVWAILLSGASLNFSAEIT
jgi:hypothetical protein